MHAENAELVQIIVGKIGSNALINAVLDEARCAFAGRKVTEPLFIRLGKPRVGASRTAGQESPDKKRALGPWPSSFVIRRRNRKSDSWSVNGL